MSIHENKKTMSLPLAVVLMVLIAAAGTVAFFTERNQKMNLLDDKDRVMQEQQSNVLATYDRIEKNLASIRESENMISKDFSSPEYNSNLSPEDRIQNEINYIRNLIDENNSLIASLNNQIDIKNARIEGYEKNIRDYQAKVTGFQQQLDQLVAEKELLKKDLDNTIRVKEQLATQVVHLDSTVTEKNGVIADQQQQITDRELALHTAYYRVDNYRNLRDQEILEKEGGVLGINRVTSLSDNLDNGLFAKIDTREVTKIPIAARRWEIVTGQDPSSYEVVYDMNKETEWLNITDPEKFWSKSKYLVVVVRDNNSELASSR